LVNKLADFQFSASAATVSRQEGHSRQVGQG